MKTKVIDWKIFAVAALALMVLGVQQAGAQTVNGAVSLSQLSISPQPVVAGDNVTIDFQLFNSYVNPLKNVVIQITASNPILNVSPSTIVLINTVAAGGTVSNGGNSAFSYTFHVPSTISAGEYAVDVQVTYDAEAEVSPTYSTDEPGTSIVPISFYVYGKPNIQLVAQPQGQLVPGAQNIFEIQAINTGTDIARNVTVKFLSSNDFSPYGSPLLNFGIMQSGTMQTGTATLLTSTNLSRGSVGIPVLISYTAESGISYNYTANIPISFNPGNPNIEASIQSAIPAQLTPGSNQTMTVLVQNNGYSEARNLSVKFLDTGPLTITGSASSYLIGTLQQGASATEQVQITASRNASQTSYNLPVVFTYKNLSSNATISTTKYMTINLQNSAIFNITAVYGEPTPGGTYQPLTFKIKNIGNEEAQQLTLSLQTVYPLTPTNPNYYISSLAPGQSTNATFYVNTASTGTNGTYPVTVYEQWRQPNGYTTQQYSSSTNYYAPVSVSNGYALYEEGAAVVIIITAAVAIYRRVGKGRKKGSGK